MANLLDLESLPWGRRVLQAEEDFRRPKSMTGKEKVSGLFAAIAADDVDSVKDLGSSFNDGLAMGVLTIRCRVGRVSPPTFRRFAFLLRHEIHAVCR